MIQGITTTIYVPDMGRAVHFYTNTLGLPLAACDDTRALLPFLFSGRGTWPSARPTLLFFVQQHPRRALRHPGQPPQGESQAARYCPTSP